MTKLNLNEIAAFVFDFDGVLTDNRVHISTEGQEYVTCNRSDGLAFDVLRKIQKPAYILSTEKNPVVAARARKLKIPVIYGVEDKLSALIEMAKEQSFDLGHVMYVGNDVNDYHVMKECGYSACPADSHKRIKELATVILSSAGGDAVARELVEEVFELDFINILYSDRRK